MTVKCPSDPPAEKACFRCKAVKPLTEYYAHPQMGDGHLGKCKECTKVDVKARYALTIEERHAYEARRNATPERKKQLLESNKRRKLAHPEKARARNAVVNAVRDGRLARLPCEVCGDLRVEGHHEDYSKPLDVRWLCFTHHREVHGQRHTARGAGKPRTAKKDA